MLIFSLPLCIVSTKTNNLPDNPKIDIPKLMKKILCAALSFFAIASYASERTETLLKNWNFSQDSLKWQPVTIPHDWAIYGPFARQNDMHRVAV